MNPEISSTGRFVDRIARSRVLDPLADALQPAMKGALDGSGRLAPLKDALHGKALGHSLHAVVTDVPIGAWTLATVFDALELTGSQTYAPAAELAIGFGLLAATAAIVTGWAEWSDTSGEPKRLGIAHALGNAVGFTAYVAALVLRRRGARRAGIASAYVGYTAVAFAAYLGGELSTGLQIGVKHTTAPLVPPPHFTAVFADADLPVGEPRRAELDGIAVLLSRDARGVIRAVSAVCTHRGGPLEAGTFTADCVTCPWHGARFSLADGRVAESPATFPLARFETRVLGGQIEIRPMYG